MTTHTNTYNSKSQTYSTPKPGRTILIKTSTSLGLTFNSNDLDTLTGFQTKFYATKSSSYFVTFVTPDNANEALTNLTTKYGSEVTIKFATYNVYFTLQGLDDTCDYNVVKTLHAEFINKMAECNVLYYRLYRKNNVYVGCGDFTVDTKEGFNLLMDQDFHKNFTLNDTLRGVHYKYNKTKLTGTRDNTTRSNTYGNTYSSNTYSGNTYSNTPRDNTTRSNTYSNTPRSNTAHSNTSRTASA